MRKASILWIALVPFVLAASAAEPPPPVPVPATCPGLGPRMAPIPGLTTGQAIGDGETWTTLRFSSQALACGEWSNEVRGADCSERWSFSIGIPQGVLRPGVYELAQLQATFGDLFVKTEAERLTTHFNRFIVVAIFGQNRRQVLEGWNTR